MGWGAAQLGPLPARTLPRLLPPVACTVLVWSPRFGDRIVSRMHAWTMRLVGRLAPTWVLAVGTGWLQAFSLVDWNLSGNGATSWEPESPQVAAIGRHLQYFDADVITLQEIPLEFSDRMPAIVQRWLPGYHLALSPGSDGYIRSAILSRVPFRRYQSWLDDASLSAFGYEGRFTRDLFEAEIALPGYPTPVHVFTTHLKNGSDGESSLRRAAEAGAISNFLVRIFLPAHPGRPYVLTGDMNEDAARPGSQSRDAIGRLVNDATGLRLLTPRNPVSGSERTWPAGGAFLFVRFDYVLPSPALYSRVARAEVFRESLLSPPPAPLLPGDEATASDHLPILVVFRAPNPGRPVLTWESTAIPGAHQWELRWQGWAGYTFQLLSSEDLQHWRLEATFQPTGTRWYGWRPETTSSWRFYHLRRIP